MPRAGKLRKAVVVGGGPAGLEAARVCAERGHKVVLFEAAGRLGGQVLIAARAGWRKVPDRIVDWRRQELKQARCYRTPRRLCRGRRGHGRKARARDRRDGGHARHQLDPGGEHCASVWDALTGNVPLGSEIIVYDGTGRHPAPQFAELAASEGRHVSLVSIDAQLAQELTYAERVIWKKRAYELRLAITFEHQIEKVERRGNRILATFRNIVTGTTTEREGDQIVVEHGTFPADRSIASCAPIQRMTG